jgi:hypothetical protein
MFLIAVICISRDLLELLEHSFQLLLRHTCPGINYHHFNGAMVFQILGRRRPQFHGNRSRDSLLDRVRYEVGKHLAQASLVADQ